MCGEMSIADLDLYVLVAGLKDGTYCVGVGAAVLEKCPRLREAARLVGAHAKVVAWNGIVRTKI